MSYERLASVLMISAVVACASSSEPPAPQEVTDAQSVEGEPSADLPPISSEPTVQPLGPPDAGGVVADSGPALAAPPAAAVRPLGCPAANLVAAPGQRVAIRSLNFQTSEIVLQNVSNTPITIGSLLDPDSIAWQWCQFPAYWHVLPAGPDVTLLPGETLAFVPARTKGVAWPLPSKGEEMAIYDGPGTYTDPDRIVAYVAWGAGPFQDGRESVAARAGFWTSGDRVRITRGAAGLLAIGSVDRRSGFAAVARNCLEYDSSVRAGR